jgi:glycosyltransferase involved in cell wall biosynthesis
LIEVFHTTSLGTLKGELQMLLYRPLFRDCDMLVYVCETQRSYWRRRFLRARHETVIHNGIDVDRFSDRYPAEEKEELRRRYGFAPDDYVIGLCAVMRPEKAHDDMLRAVVMAVAAGVDIKCLFIGDGPERARIEGRIGELGLGGRVRLTGFLRDVRPLIAACDAMALVSHHVETFSIAALEAMALGKPMVMSRIGGAGEQVIHGQNGYLFEHGDIASLADALCRLADATLRKRMSERARAVTTERFSLTAMVRAYERVFGAMVRPPLSIAFEEAGHGR